MIILLLELQFSLKLQCPIYLVASNLIKLNQAANVRSLELQILRRMKILFGSFVVLNEIQLIFMINSAGPYFSIFKFSLY